MEYSVQAHNELCCEISITYDQPEAFHVLLASDIHWDNPHCDRDMFIRHLEKVKALGGTAIIAGDFFDVMAGFSDKRRSKELLRKEYLTGNYLQDVVFDAREQLLPYRGHIAVMGKGNHEQTIRKYQEVDIMKWLTYELKREGSPVIDRGYQGFVKIVFRRPEGGKVRSIMLFFHHGKYGGVVSKGAQGVARHGLILPDAEIVMTGHTHDAWYIEQSKYHVLANNEVVIREQLHFKCPTYKQEFLSASGFGPERIVMPKPMGAWMLHLTPGRDSGVTVEFSRMK